MDNQLHRTTSEDSSKSQPSPRPYPSTAFPSTSNRRYTSSDSVSGVNARPANAQFASRSPSILWPDARQHLLRRLSVSAVIEDASGSPVPLRRSADIPRDGPVLFHLPSSIVSSTTSLNSEADRAGFIPLSWSFRSLRTAIMSGPWSTAASNASSVVGSDEDSARANMSGPTMATSSASASGVNGNGSYFPHHERSAVSESTTPSMPPPSQPASASLTAPEAHTARSQPIPRNNRRALNNPRRVSGVFPGSSSPVSDRSAQTSVDGRDSVSQQRPPSLGIIGICALDSKARSKPSRNILNKINQQQEFEVIIFGDKVILDEAPENWPLCDYLISFFSDGFPLDKAISYVRLRKPFCVNDLPMQMVLWDRRICLRILDKFDVPTPKRVEVSRDGGPTLPSSEVARHVLERTGIKIRGPDEGSDSAQQPPSRVVMLDEDTLSVDGMEIKKPFVEKPMSGEDHNINIYYASSAGGGGRRLFRKINNKSSDADDTLNVPRAVTDPNSSYIFEKFLSTDDNEDVKAYTVGPNFCHAETRKSPTVDGIVKRNTHGKEMRYVTALSPLESSIAARISEAFGQRVCGFDLLRTGGKSYVIDVNGWSFVKDNSHYYDECARILKELFVEEKCRKEGKPYTVSEADFTAESRRQSTSQFSSAFKNMLKSPSMSRLAGHHHHHHHHTARGTMPSSPDLGGLTMPITSPPSLERPQPAHLPGPVAQDPLTPPAAMTTSDPNILDSAQDAQQNVPAPASKAQWKLKGMVAVIRHADRTPKQKFKFTFHSKYFVELLKGHRQEVVLNGEAALNSVMEAVRLALKEGLEDPDKLKLLRTSLARKGSWPGTKVQIKPMFRKKKSPNPTPTTSTLEHDTDSHDAADSPVDSATQSGTAPPQTPHRSSVNDVTLSREAAEEDNLELEKLQLIIKWGGEPTHSARYQAQELGENMRNDLLLMNRDAIGDLQVYSSSERRVTTSAHIWTSAFLDQKEIPHDFVQIRKALLDDSNAAKDEMDKVKKKLKGLLRQGKKAPSQFTWPGNMPEPYIVVRRIVVLMQFHRDVMRQNYSKLYGGAASSLAAAVKTPSSGSTSPGSSSALSQVQAVNKIQGRWCSGEDADLFKERWEKLFAEFCDPEKVDPSKISELHDTMKFDAVHNRPFLEWIFTPSPEMLEAFNAAESMRPDRPQTRARDNSVASQRPAQDAEPGLSRRSTVKSVSDSKHNSSNIAERMGFKRRADTADSSSQRSGPSSTSGNGSEPYFKLYTGGGKSRNEQGLEKLRELFNYAKILFDYIGPQEYGIKDSEKLEIGLLTSLPLLRAIVNDLEDMQASEGAKSSVYFTKESHIYTLLNCIIEGGIETKIERNKIPELDYLSTICFELYESQNSLHDETDEAFNYSIRITISPGCHAFEPLDVQLDSRHCIGFAPRRSLTAHNDWKHVIETLRAKFHTVKLPKSFVAINLAEKAPQAFEDVQDATSAKSEETVQVGPESIGGDILRIRSQRPGFDDEAAGPDFAGLAEESLAASGAKFDTDAPSAADGQKGLSSE